MTIKYFTKQYAGMLPGIFSKRTPFLRVFGGELQIKTDAEYNDKFLDLKITDTDVTIQNYSKDANTAFGTGTGNSNRFGPRHEVKSLDKTVLWEAPLAIHDGVDRFTVNDIPAEVVAERLALHGSAWAGHVNTYLGKAISDNASETLTGELTEAGVTKLFADAHAKFINNNVSPDIAWVAYVNTELYNLLIDSNLAKTDKNSSVNVDNQTLYKFKGFELEELPDTQFSFHYALTADVALVTGKEYFTRSGDVGAYVYTEVETPDVDNIATYYEKVEEQAYFTAIGIGVAGVGIEVARTIDSEDFAGVAIQGAGQYAKYIPEKNKKAILKATLTAPTPEG